MGIYFAQDVQVDDGGELQFENGDLKLASVKRSHLQALHWLIASNRNDCIYGDATANLGAWFGRLNINTNHRAMEEQITRAIIAQRIFTPGDVRVAVIPVAENDVAITAHLFGSFQELDPRLEDDGYATLAYLFPFGTAVLEKVV